MAISTTPKPLKSEYEASVKKVFDNEKHINEKYRISLRFQLNCKSEDLYFYKLLTHVIEGHEINGSELYEAEDLSERDLDVMLYGRLFNLLFSNRNNIRVFSGETKFENFKIDYRVRFYYKMKPYDISHVEIGKTVTSTKVKDDHTKILLESKAIIKSMINTFPFILPSTFKIPSIQLCGLKGGIIGLEMNKENSYVAERLGERLRVPLNSRRSEKAISFFQQLLQYRNEVINTVNKLRDCIHENDDRRRSLEKYLGCNKQKAVSYKDWVQ